MQTEKNIWLRVLSMILTLALLISCVPNQVYAIAGVALADLLEATDTAVLQPDATPEPTLGTARIVSEDTSRRGEFYKEYIMNNGLRYATVYPSAIHYEEGGQWKDIDNTLVAAISGGKSVYQNKAGAWNVRFPRSLSGNDMIGITKDGFTVQFGMAGEMRSSGDLVVASIGQVGATADTLAVSSAQTATAQIQQIDLTEARAAAEHPETILDKLNSRLTYANVYPNTNVVYDLQGNQLKESVILQQYDATLWGYRYTLDTGDLIPVLREDQQIDLCHPDTNEVVLTMPAPYMFDNNGESCYDVDVALKRNGNNYLLSYYLPREWLADANRAWPVILDPVVAGNSRYTNVKDVTVAETGTESSTRGVIQCGYLVGSGAMRMYMQYINLPIIPSGNVIVDATISLMKPMNYATASNVEVYKVTEPWTSSTITWADKDNYEENIISDYVVCQNAGRYIWNITNIVRDWYETGNYGMMFKTPSEVEEAGVNNWKQFYSSDYSNSADTLPALTITYQNHNGLEDYWSYSSSSAGRAGTGYVNLFTGNLVWVRNDLGFDGNRMPVSISHIYNSNDSQTNKFGMGYGWRTNYNQIISSLGNGVYIWEDGDGTGHEFVTASGVTTDVDGLHLTLTVKDGNNYVLTDLNGNVSEFTDGKLTRMANNLPEKETSQTTIEEDTHEGPKYLSEIIISYDSATGFISQISDGAGRKYQFHYQSGLLNKISYKGAGDTELTSVLYTYASGDLTRITDKDSRFTSYSYSENHLLVTAQDVTNYCITYSYTEEPVNKLVKHVAQIKEYDAEKLGNSATFTYSPHYTVVQDHNGNHVFYRFNDWGDLVAVHDSAGQFQQTKYALNDVNDQTSNTTELHQVLEVSDVGGTTCNLIPDGSFENGSVWETFETVKAEISTEHAYLGQKSMKVYVPEGADDMRATGEWFFAETGETYTFSLYVYLESGAEVTIIVEDYGRDYTVSRKLEGNENEWVRHQVTYTHRGAAGETVYPRIAITKGTAYVDCVQIEKAASASKYSAVVNGDAEVKNDDGKQYFRGWSANFSTSSDDFRHETDSANSLLSGGALRITGDPNAAKMIEQTIPIDGKEGDEFVLAGLAKAYAAPLVEYQYANQDNPEENLQRVREFGLKLIFNNKEGLPTEHYVSFDPVVSGRYWQYAALTAKADKDFDSITIQAVYSYQANEACFDGLQLYAGRAGASYTYGTHKNVVTETDILGKTTTYTYYDNGIDLKSVDSSVGSDVIYTYDQYHNVETMTETTEASSDNQYTTAYRYTYDKYGNVLSVTVTHSSSTSTVPLIQKSSTEYIDGGNYIRTTTDGNGETTTYHYDPNTGVLLWVQYPKDTTGEDNTIDTRTYYTYDEMFQLIKIHTSSNQLDEDSQNVEMSAEYTYSNDLLVSLKTKSTTYGFTYDKFDLRTSVKIGGNTVATYHYTENENSDTQEGENHYLEGVDYANTDSVRYTYDILGRVIKEEYYENGETEEPDRAISYAYSNNGALAIMYDSATGLETVCYYDNAGRVERLIETGNGEVRRAFTYSYDENGNIVKTEEYFKRQDLDTDENGDHFDDYFYNYYCEYFYDYKNRIESVKTGNSKKEYTYDGLDRLTKETVSRINGESYVEVFNNTYTYKTYEDATVEGGIVTTNQVEKIQTTSRERKYEKQHIYTYDQNGNILSISDGDEDDPKIITYEYDTANQLIRENNPYANRTWKWTYDGAGNITSRTEYFYTTGEPSVALDTITYGYPGEDSGWRDLLQTYGDREFVYDACGNLIEDNNADGSNNRTYTWSQGRQLTAVTKNGSTYEYLYDANGLCTRRTVSSLAAYIYEYNGTQLSAFKFQYFDLRFTYDAAGRPLTVTYHRGENCGNDSSVSCGSNCGTYYYVTNLQGDVIAILNDTGYPVVKYTYDAWGKLLTTEGSLAGSLGYINPLRYRGYIYDPITEFYYLQSRYYDPEIGRFISADNYPSTGQGLTGNNMFAYCGNNPVSRNDEGGEFWNVVAGAIIGAVVNTAVSYITTTMAGEEFSWADAAVAFASGAITGAVAATGLGFLGQACVGFAVGFGGSIGNNLLEGEDISWETATINGVAGFVGGLIGGDGIRKAGGKLDVAKKALDSAKALKNSGAKMVRNTVTKNLNKAATNYADVYAVESLITLGRFYAGAWAGAIISQTGSVLFG